MPDSNVRWLGYITSAAPLTQTFLLFYNFDNPAKAKGNTKQFLCRQSLNPNFSIPMEVKTEL